MAVKEPGMGSAQPCAKVIMIMIVIMILMNVYHDDDHLFSTDHKHSYFRAPKSFMPGLWTQKALNFPKGYVASKNTSAVVLRKADLNT